MADAYSRALRVFVAGREIMTWDEAAGVAVIADPSALASGI